MKTQFDPDDSQAATLRRLDPEAPVAALNLFQFNDRARYTPGEAASRHRKAGLANRYQVHLNGAPWVEE